MSQIFVQPLPSKLYDSLTYSFRPFEVEIPLNSNQDLAGQENTKSKTLYARKTFGAEGLCAFRSETGSGCSQITTSSLANFTSSIFERPPWSTHVDLVPFIKRAWIRTRYNAPGIACRTFAIPMDPSKAEVEIDDDENLSREHYFTYEIPEDEVELDTWTEESIKIWTSEPAIANDNVDLFDQHSLVPPVSPSAVAKSKDGAARPSGLNLDQMDFRQTAWYWKSKDGRLNFELHVARHASSNAGEWIFGLNTIHAVVDARGSMLILDQFLGYLIEELNAIQPIQQMNWGTELSRLPAAAGILAQERLEPEDKEICVNSPVEETKCTPPTPPKPFTRPYEEISIPPCPQPPFSSPTQYPRPPRPLSESFPSITGTVTLNPSITSAFQKSCKKRGQKLTAVLDAILALVETEDILECGIHLGGKRWEDLKNQYETSDIFNHGAKIMDMRDAIPNKYTTDALYQTPMMALHITCTPQSMSLVRKVLPLSPTGTRIEKNFSKETFWDGVVKDAKASWDQAVKPTARQFASRESLYADSLPHCHDPKSTSSSGFSHNSLGDFDKMGAISKPNDPRREAFLYDSVTGASAPTKYGIMGRWNPTVLSQSRAPTSAIDSTVPYELKVTSIRSSGRHHRSPGVVARSFLYNGRLVVQFCGGSAFYTRGGQFQRLARKTEEMIKGVLDLDKDLAIEQATKVAVAHPIVPSLGTDLRINPWTVLSSMRSIFSRIPHAFLLMLLQSGLGLFGVFLTLFFSLGF